MKFRFSAPLDRSTVSSNIISRTAVGANVAFNVTYQNADNTLVLQPASPLAYLAR